MVAAMVTQKFSARPCSSAVFHRHKVHDKGERNIVIIRKITVRCQTLSYIYTNDFHIGGGKISADRVKYHHQQG